MKKACLFVHGPYQNNLIFDEKSKLNRDNCLEFFRELKSQLALVGFDLQTQDRHAPADSDLIVYNEVPNHPVEFPEKSVALLYESELIRPQDWTDAALKQFRSVFTWHDEYVDNKKYFKFNFTHSGQVLFKTFSQKSKLCALIAGNKAVKHPLELYSKRMEAILWFERNHPEDFDLYGMGWDTYSFDSNFLNKVFKKLRLAALLKVKRPSYRGPVDSKLETLSQYKFSICYENARGIPGYITEKIFDSLAAGCVPVYWGAPNISQYVPKECCIDKEQFETYEDLYSFMTNMSEAVYQRYLNAIKAYLSSQQHQQFESHFNAQVVAQRIAHAEI